MQCTQFEQIIEQEADGPLSSSATLHLGTCAGCRLLWTDLSAIREAGQDWGAEVIAPPARVWARLHAQMESEGLIGAAKHQNGLGSQNWLSRWFGSEPRLGLAAASASLLLIAATLAGFGTWSVSAPTQNSTNENVSALSSGLPAGLDARLDVDLKRVMASIPAREPLASSLQKNLAIVDNLISLCEKSVREQPDNPAARDYLYGAYKQKADLLATAMDRSSTLEDQ